MKPLIINPEEQFVLNGTLFKYCVINGNIQLTKLGAYDKKVKPKFIPPTLSQVKDYFKEKGYSEASAVKFFDSYEAGEPKWHDSRGNPVRAWKQKAVNVWFTDQNRIVEPPITKDNKPQMVR